MIRSTRLGFVSAGAAVASALALPSCGAPAAAYDAAADRTWRPFDEHLMAPPGFLREVVRYATLAPSSHNTQCWRFHIAPNSIAIVADRNRRCPAVDPDDHHVFVSLGCATENVVLAAGAHGFRCAVRVDPGAAAVHVDIARDRVARSPLFGAIPFRQQTRGPYDGRSVSPAGLRSLQTAAAGPGVRTLLFTDPAARERILDAVVAANTLQMQDAAFVAELRSWIRFGDAEAIATGDGLSTRASGSPSLPRWLGEAVFPFVFTAAAENDRYAKQIRSSAGIAVFAADVADATHWVAIGRAYQRFALRAVAMGVRVAMINQPVEVTAVRPQFAAAIGLAGTRPDLVVRFGYGAAMPRSLRRPVDAVLA